MNLIKLKQRHKKLQIQNQEIIFFRGRVLNKSQKLNLIKNKELNFFLNNSKKENILKPYIYGNLFFTAVNHLLFFKLFSKYSLQDQKKVSVLIYKKIIFNYYRLKSILGVGTITGLKKKILAELIFSLSTLLEPNFLQNVINNIKNAPTRR